MSNIDQYGFDKEWLAPEAQSSVYRRFNAQGELIVDGEAYVLSHFSSNHVFCSRMMSELVKYIKLGDHVLSIAEGQGHLVKELRTRGIEHVCGIDVCAENVAVAQRQGLNVVLGDAHHLNYDDDLFDIVIINESIGAIGLDQSIREAKRVLKIGGSLIITTYEYVEDEDKEVDSQVVKYKYVLPSTVIRALQKNDFDDVMMQPIAIQEIPQELIDDGQMGDSVNLIVARNNK